MSTPFLNNVLTFEKALKTTRVIKKKTQDAFGFLAYPIGLPGV